MINVAINGFGRIGRLAFREMMKSGNLNVVAINDLSSPSMLAYLLKYDSVQGIFKADISHSENELIVDNKHVAVYAERIPQNLPWAKHHVDLVLECTGIFESKEKASAHFTAGARKVIISAPSDKDVKTIVFNVNHTILQKDDQLVSCASCTTNCLAPMAKVLNDQIRNCHRTNDDHPCLYKFTAVNGYA